MTPPFQVTVRNGRTTTMTGGTPPARTAQRVRARWCPRSEAFGAGGASGRIPRNQARPSALSREGRLLVARQRQRHAHGLPYDRASNGPIRIPFPRENYDLIGRNTRVARALDIAELLG